MGLKGTFTFFGSEVSVAKHPQHNIYVIELNSDVLKKKKFCQANPDFKGKKPCVYVGMTGRTPEERFEQHKSGYKSNKYVKKFGVRLRPRLYKSHNPMTYDEARYMEEEKARRLRKRGYAVWQK